MSGRKDCTGREQQGTYAGKGLTEARHLPLGPGVCQAAGLRVLTSMQGPLLERTVSQYNWCYGIEPSFGDVGLSTSDSILGLLSLV